MDDMDIPLPPAPPAQQARQRAPSPLYSPTSPTSDHEDEKSAAAAAAAAAAAEAAAKAAAASKPVLSREVFSPSRVKYIALQPFSEMCQMGFKSTPLGTSLSKNGFRLTNSAFWGQASKKEGVVLNKVKEAISVGKILSPHHRQTFRVLKKPHFLCHAEPRHSPGRRHFTSNKPYALLTALYLFQSCKKCDMI